MRPIDANALKDKISNIKFRVKSSVMMAGLVEMKATALREIENASTIEAEPARHGRWIPCSDALPASICRVLVTTFAGNVGVAVFNPEKKRWYKNGEFYDLCLIIAWQPMTDAYEPPKEDEA